MGAETEPVRSGGLASGLGALPSRARGLLAQAASAAAGVVRPVGLLAGFLFFSALSLLPLTALLLMLPLLVPQETVLTESARGRWFSPAGLLRALFHFLIGLVVLVALGVASVELVGWLPWAGPDLSATVYELAPGWKAAAAELPAGLRDHPAAVVLCVYVLDLVLLAAVGKVPLAYNVRNLLVRWRITLLTSFAFTTVVALLVVMLAFVNGMYALTQSTGVPGNVFILSDGSTDEFFSDLGYQDLSKIAEARAELNTKDQPLAVPVGVKREDVTGDGRPDFMYSRETYLTISQPVPNPQPGKPKRRFIQLRGMYDAKLAGLVHGVEVLPGGEWYSNNGARPDPDPARLPMLECCVGEGIAATLGSDIGKPRLNPGDSFELGDRKWYVCGVMKTEGTTFGSEVWGAQDQLTQHFSKKTTTTMVARTDADTLAASRVLAHHLNTRYKDQKLKAQPEPDYYKELSKTNQQFLVAIMFVAAVMAVGGVFGVMNTMFAAISQRTKDIGVLRILGFKRWQVLVSFLLESLVIALVGGALGCALGALCDGFQATSIMSSGQGGGRSVVLRLTVGADILVAGMLFTLLMGRLGGLVPSLSAMRLRILDTLR